MWGTDKQVGHATEQGCDTHTVTWAKKEDTVCTRAPHGCRHMPYAGTHASGRAGQHFELFDSILGRVKKVTTHNHSLRVKYVR